MNAGWVKGALVLFTILLGGYVWSALGPPATGPHGGATTPFVSDLSGVRLRAWADHSDLDPCQVMRVWLTIENRSSGAVDALLAGFHAPGFGTRGCFRSADGACRFENGAPLKIGPAASAVMFMDLVAALEPQSTGVTVVVTVQQGEGSETIHTAYAGPLSIGEKASVGLVVARAILEFFKDLALPILLGAAAYGFQRIQQSQAELQETWKEIFPRAYENSMKYLMPSVASGRGLMRNATIALSAAPAKAEDATHRCFFYLIGMLKAWREMADEGGAIFVREARAEEFLYEGWGSLRRTIEAQLGYERLSHILDRFSRKDSIAAFNSRFAYPPTGWIDPVFAQMKGDVASWIRSKRFGSDAKLLEGLCEATEYEINAMCSSWYPRKHTPPEKAIRRLLQELERSTENTALVAATKDYLGRLENG